MLRKFRKFLQKYTSTIWDHSDHDHASEELDTVGFDPTGYDKYKDFSPSYGNVNHDQCKEVQCSEEEIASIHYDYYHSEKLVYSSPSQWTVSNSGNEAHKCFAHYVDQLDSEDDKEKSVHRKNCRMYFAQDVTQENNEEEQEEEGEEIECTLTYVSSLESSSSNNITFSGSLENVSRESSPLVDTHLESFPRLHGAEEINHNKYVINCTENCDHENEYESKYTTQDTIHKVIPCFMISDDVTLISPNESYKLSLQDSYDEVTQEINSPIEDGVFYMSDRSISYSEGEQQKDLNPNDLANEARHVLKHSEEQSKVYHFTEHHLLSSLPGMDDILVLSSPGYINDDVDNTCKTTEEESPEEDVISSCLGSNGDSASNHKEDSFDDKEESTVLRTNPDFSSQWTVNGNDASEYVPLDSSKEVSYLYNQKGEICTFSNKRYIKTLIQGSQKLFYVIVKKRIVSGVRVGCQVIWNEQTPIPLSDVADGNKVKFDAVFVPDENAFQALVVWKQKKPKYALEPSNRNYLWIDSRTIKCQELATQNGKNFIRGFYDKKKIFAEIPNDAIFVNGCPSNFKELKRYHDSSKTIVARISRLLAGGKGESFKYICSCISYGSLPSKKLVFKRGELYRSGPNNTIVVDKSPLRLYCDVSCQLKKEKDVIMVEFENENKIISALVTKEFNSCNSRLSPSHLVEGNVKTDILSVSVSEWVILLTHCPKIRTCNIISPSATVRSKSENMASREPLFVWLQKISSKDKSTIYTVPVSKEDSESKHVPSSRCSKLETAPSKSETKDCVPKCSQKDRPSTRGAYPKFINDATGVLIDVSGDYGILEIHNKIIKGTGRTLAAFHRSVAYVDQWSLYEDVPLVDQLLDLISKTWHCSLKRHQRVICQRNVDYEVTLAWQGRKPVERDAPYIIEFQYDDDTFSYDSFQTEDGGLETLVFYNEKYNESNQGENLSKVTPDLNGHQGSSLQAMSSKATECSADDVEYNEFALDDANLFPTVMAGEEKEIVDAFGVTLAQYKSLF